MKFVSVRAGGAIHPGVVVGDEILLLADHFPDVVAIVEAGPAGLNAVAAALGRKDGRRRPLAGATLASPLTRFRRDVLCTGWNYWDHFEEGHALRPTQDKPKAPTFFNKGPDCVIGPNEDIGIDPSFSVTWDYEVEMALVVGTAGRSIRAEDALAHVFGYMLANDVSQRDLQRRHGGQWMKGKTLDGTLPLGPYLVTPDEVDPQDLALECTLNGTVMQSARTRQMAFAIPDLIAELSFGMTLRPGDVLLTGTPSGVGQSRKPPVFLKPGDMVETSGAGLGRQCNRIVAADLRGASAVRLEG